MILQALNELYDRLKDDPDYGIVEPGYSMQPIAFVIVVDKDGQVVKIKDIREPDNQHSKKVRPKPLQVLGGNKPSGSGLNPTFLWDTVGYLLGWRKKKNPATLSEEDRIKEEKEQKRTAAAHDASRKYHESLQTEINDEGFSAVCKFYQHWQVEDIETKYSFITGMVGGYGVFQLDGEVDYIHNRPAIQKWYAASLANSDENVVKGYSLLSGENVSIAKLHEQIKGIGEKSASLVSFNNSAYVSYGKEQSFNAPISKIESFRYTTALNALTNGPKRKRHLIGMGDGSSRVSVVFWASKKDDSEELFSLLLGGGLKETVAESVASSDKATTDDDLFSGTTQAETSKSAEKNDTIVSEKIRAAFQRLRTGNLPAGDLNIDVNSDFYILGLSVNVTRVVVRFFVRSSFGVIMENFRRHFLDMELASNPKAPKQLPSVRMILDQTCPPKNNKPDREKIPANLEGLLFRSILLGTPYPAAVYRQILRRLVLDVNDYNDFYKVAFIKAFLIRNYRKEFQMSLNVEIDDPGYLCGRLFAVLEKTQRDALNDTNSTVRGSYMASAAAHPASVFPRLFKLYTHHLAKLNPGMQVVRERVLQEIMNKFSNELPTALDYTQQGAFFIGFYQQMQDFFTKKENNEETPSDNAPEVQTDLFVEKQF